MHFRLNRQQWITPIRILLYIATFAAYARWLYRDGWETYDALTALLSTLLTLFAEVAIHRSNAFDAERELAALTRLVGDLKDKIGVQHFVPLGLMADDKPLDVDTLFQDKGRTVLLGGPGTGKSTLLHILALRAAEARQKSGSEKPLPFLVSLADWPRRQSLRAFLRSQWPYGGDPTTAIKEGRHVWLLADDLDALGPARAKQIQQLQNWIGNEQRGPSRVTVACRTGAYDNTLQLPLSIVTLNHPLCDNEVRLMAEEYLGTQAADFLALVAAEPPAWSKACLAEWAETNPLRFMVTDSQRLTVVMEQFKQSKDGNLSWNPGILLDSYMQKLWHRIERRGEISGLSFHSMKAACSQMPGVSWNQWYPMQVPLKRELVLKRLWRGLLRSRWQSGTLLQRSALATWLGINIVAMLPLTLVKMLFFELRPLRLFVPKERGDVLMVFWLFALGFLDLFYYTSFSRRHVHRLLKALVSADLLMETDGEINIPNREIGQYFCALKYFYLDSSFEGILLSPRSRGRSIVVPQYHPIILMGAGIAHDADAFVNKLVEIDALLAAKCVASGVQVYSQTRDRVVTKTTELMMNLHEARDESEEVLGCARVLCELSGPTFADTLVSIIETNGHFFYREYAELFVGLGPNVVPRLLDGLEMISPRQNGLRCLLAALGRIGDTGDTEALDRLRMLCKKAESDWERIWLTATLANLGDDDARQQMTRYLRRETYMRLDGKYYCEPWVAIVETTERDDLFEYLIGVLSEPTEYCKACFPEVIKTHFQKSSTIPKIEKAYQDKKDEPAVLAILAKALAKLGDPCGVNILLKHFAKAELNFTELEKSQFEEDGQLISQFRNNHELKLNVIEALGKLKAKVAVDVLGRYLRVPKCLHDEEKDEKERAKEKKKKKELQVAAIVALKEIGDPKATPGLWQLRTNETCIPFRGTAIAEAAVDALIEIGHQQIPQLSGEAISNGIKRKDPDALKWAAEYWIERLEAAEYDSEAWRRAWLKLGIIGLDEGFEAINRITAQEESKTQSHP